MAEFKVGDVAILLANGAELEMSIARILDKDVVVVETLKGYKSFNVSREALLPVKGPFFGVRGLVFTTKPQALQRTR